MLKEDIAIKNTILRVTVGSKLHGLGIGSDDTDEMGVCVEPPTHVIGLEKFEHYVYRTQPEGHRSGPGDLDLTIYSLRKFCSLAAKGNPSILALLYAPEEFCVIKTDEGKALQDNWEMFASKKAGACFAGYMRQQLERLKGERGQKNVKRPELEEKYGFDTKYAAHILRLGLQGIEYMETGRLTLPMKESEKQFNLGVRQGEYEFNNVLTLAASLDAMLLEAIDKTELPDVPDYDKINKFLIDTYISVWKK